MKTILLGLVALAVLAWVSRQYVAARRRQTIRRTPLSSEERQVLSRNLAIYGKLPPERKRELEAHAQAFRATKRFEGCGGLELTDEIVLTLAASASVLLLGRGEDHYSKLSTVLVYPSAFTGKGHRDQESGDVTRLGESWGHGTVILAWDAALRGAVNDEDGSNVVYHEFAHQLDQADGRADGTPDLGGNPDRYRSWAKVLGSEFLRLRERDEAGRRTLLDTYGATNEAEFFAVASEFFFEKPEKLAAAKPELYAQLRDFYHQDPILYRAGES